MWQDFIKKLIPQTPTLSKGDMELYKKYLKNINYTIHIVNVSDGIKKSKPKGKKRFNRTSCKNKT
jgi:hypothetical protein